MAKPRQESIKSPDGPRLLRVVDLYVKEDGGRASREIPCLSPLNMTPVGRVSKAASRGLAGGTILRRGLGVPSIGPRPVHAGADYISTIYHDYISTALR